MNTRTLLPLGLSALMLGGTMVGCAAGGSGVAAVSDHAATLAVKGARVDAARAAGALARHDGAGAVAFAEKAVLLAPRDADYRMLLAQSYVQAGRFTAARQAYADVLELSPDNGKAALNEALATIATGDWQAARGLLADHAAIIPARDRGLALALAGDTQGAVTLLTALVRSPQGDAKARQNLALSFALAGQWQSARLVGGMDLPGDQLDARLAEWAAFAQPKAASDQVATLLGVRATVDRGQPTALALNGSSPAAIAVAVVAPAPIVASAPVEPMPAAAPVALASASPRSIGVTFGPRAEVVQALPVATIPATKGAIKVAVSAAPTLKGETAVAAGAPTARGAFVVQVGAFQNAGVARDAWTRMKARLGDLGGRTPQSMTFAAKGGSFYRLSVGGFARADADALCSRYRAHGGACFVRKDAGDRTAQWATRTPTQIASR